MKARAKDFVSNPFDLINVLVRVYNMIEVHLLQLEVKRLCVCLADQQQPQVSASGLLNQPA